MKINLQSDFYKETISIWTCTFQVDKQENDF